MLEILKRSVRPANRGNESPIVSLPKEVRNAYIYGGPEEHLRAADELRAWSRISRVMITSRQWEDLGMARDLIGYNFEQTRRVSGQVEWGNARLPQPDPVTSEIPSNRTTPKLLWENPFNRHN